MSPEDLGLTTGVAGAVPVEPVTSETLEAHIQGDAPLARWVRAQGFEAREGRWLACPDAGGGLARVLLGVDPKRPNRAFGALARALPPGTYRLGEGAIAVDARAAARYWGLGAYRFTAYKAAERPPAQWVLSAEHLEPVAHRLEAVWHTRDLINTPASELMPGQLAAAARDLAESFGATVEETVGEALVASGYPMVHAVGRASHHAPRVVDLRWGAASPLVVVVGKGVCFDSGGLDLKSAQGMRLMKKDMAGAAQALGLARLVMARGLPVRLRVLVPAVENAVAGNALRPGDVLRARNGRSVEIDNTDAEGRLILADCLAAVGEDETPDLILDFATLTGAARVAVGTELPALFTPNDLLARDLMEQAEAEDDPLWRLPLHDDYRYLLDSDVADLKNCASEPYAGAITAALFLREFVPQGADWVHLDFMGWNLRERPGHPKGGEAQGLLGLFAWLESRYG